LQPAGAAGPASEPAAPAALVTSAREPTLSMRFVQRLVALVEQTGVPRRELLRVLQIDATQLEDAEARVPSSRLFRVFELAIELTEDPAIGLHWAEGVTQSGFAPLSHLIAHAPNLRQAFESLSAFQRLLLDGSCFQLFEHDEKVTVRCPSLPRAPAHMQRCVAEMTVTSFFLMIRFFSGERPERVCFEYPAPAYRAEYARVFGRIERFRQPFNGIVFDHALLDLPSPYKDDDLYAALRTFAERRVSRDAQRAPYAQRVREYLVQQGSRRRVDMDDVARALGISARSLRRRLAGEGKPYKSIENDAHAFMAKQLLIEEQRTIQEAAYEMGFSDTTAFHRAFKRWTGTTPSAFRAGL
jgi:AraC-like DNA-binding protein